MWEESREREGRSYEFLWGLPIRCFVILPDPGTAFRRQGMHVLLGSGPPCGRAGAWRWSSNLEEGRLRTHGMGFACASHAGDPGTARPGTEAGFILFCFRHGQHVRDACQCWSLIRVGSVEVWRKVSGTNVQFFSFPVSMGNGGGGRDSFLLPNHISILEWGMVI